MLIKKPADIRYSEITPKSLYLNRRNFLAGLPAAFLGARELLSPSGRALAGPNCPTCRRASTRWTRSRIPTRKSPPTTTSTSSARTRDEPAEYAKNFKTSPWTVSVEGDVRQAAQVHHGRDPGARAAGRARLPPSLRGSLVDRGAVGRLLAERAAQRRWSRPRRRSTWLSKPSTIASRCRTPPGLQFPYVEGLRMDEAMHPLALLCTGMFGETLPPQDGAPVRMILPWKYGFKSIKSIVKIRLVGSHAADLVEPGEPARVRLLLQRESQGGSSALEPGQRAPAGRIPQAPTLMFNGYGDQVASLYNGMDLKKNYWTVMLKQRWTKVVVFLACLVPVLWVCWRAWHQDLTANPIEYITRYTGDWTHPVHRAYAGRHAAAQTAGPAGSDPLPPHDRAVRVLLRHAALHHVHLAG